MSPQDSFSTTKSHASQEVRLRRASAIDDGSTLSAPGVDVSLSFPRIQNIVLDLGDVLFAWSPSSPASPLPPRLLKQILRSATWFEYEKGNITEEQVYTQVAEDFGLSAEDIAGALRAARDSLQSNPALLKVIRDLKVSGRNIFAMSNISKPDWEVLKTKADPSDWALFDQVFTSAEAGERKPNLGFYRHLITHTKIDPIHTIFIDDKLENVLTARSFGMHGIVFDDLGSVVRQLINICGEPVKRARSFLEANKKQLSSVTSSGVVLRENFAQLLILEATGDDTLVDYIEYPGLHNFFQSGGTLTTEDFPNDVDTTSIGLTVAPHINSETREHVMDTMLTFRNKDGLLQVYFDHSRPRIDPIVCINALTLFYRNGRGHELDCSMDWVEQVLTHRAYMNGTLYYATPEAFLFFFSRLLESSQALHHRLGPLLRRRVAERFGAEGDTLALAMRVIAAASVGLIDRQDLNRLLLLQQQDGSWTNGWFYKYGSSGLLIGNDGITTALTIRAIEEVGKLEDVIAKAEGMPKRYTMREAEKQILRRDVVGGKYKIGWGRAFTYILDVVFPNRSFLH